MTETGFDKIPAGRRAEAFRLNPAALDQLRTYVEQISEQWDSSLARLKAFVEK